MTFFHFVSTFLLSFVSPGDSDGTNLQSGAINFDDTSASSGMVQSLSFSFLITEVLKTLIGALDLIGIYFLLSSKWLLGDQISQIYGCAIGWTMGDNLLNRLIPLWFSTRGLQFETKALQMAVYSNVVMLEWICVVIFVFLYSRKKMMNLSNDADVEERGSLSHSTSSVNNSHHSSSSNCCTSSNSNERMPTLNYTYTPDQINNKNQLPNHTKTTLLLKSSSCPYCFHTKLDSLLSDYFPCSSRELREMYGTEHFVELSSKLAGTSCNTKEQQQYYHACMNHYCSASSSSYDSQYASQTLTDMENTSDLFMSPKERQAMVNTITLKTIQLVMDPNPAKIALLFHPRFEHSLGFSPGRTFVVMGNNESNCLGCTTNEWLKFIKDDTGLELKNPQTMFVPENFEDDQDDLFETLKLSPKIYSTSDSSSEIAFVATGHDFSIFVFKCGCIGLCGTWGEGGASLFRFTWSKPLKTVCPSMFATFYVSSDCKSIYSWGFNSQGQGSTKAGDAFVLPKRVDPNLYHNETIKLVKIGSENSYMITENDKLFVAGCNGNHELGIPWRDVAEGHDNDTRYHVDYFLPENILELIKERKIVTQFTQIDYLPKKVKLVDLSIGEKHVFVLTGDGEIYFTGQNSHGQLGYSNITEQCIFEKHKWTEENNTRIRLIHCFANSTIWITVNDEVYICGDNALCEMGVTTAEGCIMTPILHPTLSYQGISKIIGNNNIFALTNDGRILCWGSNENNELGLDEATLNDNPDGIEIPIRNYFLEGIARTVWERGYKLELSAGFNHTIVYFKNVSKMLNMMFTKLEQASKGEYASDFSDVTFVSTTSMHIDENVDTNSSMLVKRKLIAFSSEEDEEDNMVKTHHGHTKKSKP
ncbi:hypothetical protein C9374_002593 [Naegleria lovaniensis]|uniref:Transmembrane protein 147 n=1 Tax=Naegleria lovaniensis TaxID=51637 RepID=A0AA88GSD4_NAELO|nr:uncharacterized protein C9374_002593 [Naegleria lovaniensis]KAG2386147.1 hypothetical protein C9374_002593 [Naegleria lovaniensis]